MTQSESRPGNDNLLAPTKSPSICKNSSDNFSTFSGCETLWFINPITESPDAV
eukprot:gene18891-895_t